jgi:hypothetical protein
MSFDHHFVDSTDPDRRLRFGAGFLLDPALRGTVVSEDRFDAEVRASEEEEQALREAAEQDEAERRATVEFWARRHGGAVPPSREEAVATVIKNYAIAADRADRKQAREERELEAKILNGEVLVPVEDERRVLAKQAAREERAKLVAKVEASNAKPATVGDVNKVKQLVGWLESKLDHANRRIPKLTDAEVAQTLREHGVRD